MTLKQRLETAGIRLRKAHLEKLDAYVGLLLEWNRVHNLTKASTPAEVYDNLADALFPLTFLPPRSSLLDIGTGAGFPGLALAIALPDTQTTLCEPLPKRSSFLGFVARELQLSNVRVFNRRIEALDPQPFTLITSRAVADTDCLVAWSRPFWGPDTALLFYKGERTAKEAENLDLPGMQLIRKERRRYIYLPKVS